MGSFKSTIITSKGHNLMAKLTTGKAEMAFTKIKSSDHDYSSLTSSQLEKLTNIEDIKQEVLVSEVERINDASVKVCGVLLNTELTEGYYIKTIALYATDPDEGEILYSITVANESDWFPPYNSISSASATFDLVTVVSNAENVSIDVDPRAVVNIEQFNEFKEQVAAQMSEIPNQSYITEKAKTTDVNNALALKANTIDLNTQKTRIDNLVQTSSAPFYQKCLSTDTGALLVVNSGATTGQINLASVTPLATGYTAVVGDYVRLVYGLASGSSELIDLRTGIGGIYNTTGNALREQLNDLYNKRDNLSLLYKENTLITGYNVTTGEIGFIDAVDSDVYFIPKGTSVFAYLDITKTTLNNQFLIYITNNLPSGNYAYSTVRSWLASNTIDNNSNHLLYKDVVNTRLLITPKTDGVYAVLPKGTKLKISDYSVDSNYVNSVSDIPIYMTGKRIYSLNTSALNLEMDDYAFCNIYTINGKDITGDITITLSTEFINIGITVQNVIIKSIDNIKNPLYYESNSSAIVADGVYVTQNSDNEYVLKAYKIKPTDIVYFCISIDCSIKMSTTKSIDTHKPEFVAGIKSFGIGGDSLSVGTSYKTITNQWANPETEVVRWADYFKRVYGIDYELFSLSGVTTRAYVSSSLLTNIVASNHPVYIIALGHNDGSLGADYLGTTSDIGTNNDTFYGNYSKIVKSIIDAHPNCFILCLNDPSATDSLLLNINIAIKNIVNYYSNCKLVDLYSYKEFFTDSVSDSCVNGHFNPQVYFHFGKIICDIIGDLIYYNQSYFYNMYWV